MVKIDPEALAFDIDGVVADTMTLFIDIARDAFNVTHLRYEDITCYILEECLDIDPEVIRSVIERLLNGDYAAELRPFDGAAEVLHRMSRRHRPILFVTARPHLGPMAHWMTDALGLDETAVEVIPTGAFEAKADVLLEKKVRYFVEDRLETCHLLADIGITPILFRQPWNREDHPFLEVGDWKEIEGLMNLHAALEN